MALNVTEDTTCNNQDIEESLTEIMDSFTILKRKYMHVHYLENISSGLSWNSDTNASVFKNPSRDDPRVVDSLLTQET